MSKLDEVFPLRFPRIPNVGTPLESDTELDQLLAATPAEYGLPVVDPDVITEADIDYGYSLILAEMEQADIDAAEAREHDDPAPVRFGVRAAITRTRTGDQ